MTSFRRAAFPLGLAAICGGALLFSLSTAKGQTVATPMAPPVATVSTPGGVSGTGNTAAGGSPTGAAAPGSTTGAPTFPSTIGVSPSFPVRPSSNTIFNVRGGTGNESYDLQIENLYSLLRERGVPIPNVLHPLSTAKPSFIVERLLVLSLSGGGANATGTTGTPNVPSSPSTPQTSRPGTPGEATGTAAQTPAGPTDAEKTVTAVRRIVDAEIAQGTGRLGGAHRQKLQLLSRAIRSIESANRLVSAVEQAVGNAQGAAGATSEAGGGTGDKSKLDPREIFYGQARKTARAADRYTPNIP